MIHISAKYEENPFTFHAFEGRLDDQVTRWENPDPVEAFKEMKRDLIRDGVCAGGEREWMPVMWSSSMTHLVFDTKNLRYRPGTLDVDGTIYELGEMLEWYSEDD
jgi:hypothetical protein